MYKCVVFLFHDIIVLLRYYCFVKKTDIDNFPLFKDVTVFDQKKRKKDVTVIARPKATL